MRRNTSRWLSIFGFVMLVLAVLAAGCSKEVNVEGVGGDGTDTGTGTGEELPECVGETDGAGPEMVAVGRTDGTCVWMDRLEVSRGEYQALIDADVDMASQSPSCLWNDSFEPDVECEANATVTASPDHPAVCVDWCDAEAFCRLEDKVLCPDSYTNYEEASKSLWYSACSNGDASYYPYGNEYRADACNGDDANKGTTAPISSLSECVNDANVQNLVGNAAEWVDACSDQTGADDQCMLRGGSYLSASDDLMCAKFQTIPRSQALHYVGFRCCRAYE